MSSDNNDVVKDDVEIPLPGLKSFVINSTISSVILTAIIFLIGWDVFVLLSKWAWRAILLGLVYLVLFLVVAVRELVLRMNITKKKIEELSLQPNMNGIKKFIKSL
tara:strand:- start:336 stop:653 length:318 start_codon:yes stop_codon:yes gene_type:complete